MLDKLTSEHFIPYLHHKFKLNLEPALELELTHIRNLGRDDEDYSRFRRPFSLWFLGPETPLLPQRMYPFIHPEYGQLDIFIVPLGYYDGGVRYEAIFT